MLVSAKAGEAHPFALVPDQEIGVKQVDILVLG